MKPPTVEERMSMMTVMKEIQTVIRWRINRDSTKICTTEINSSHHLVLVIIYLYIQGSEKFLYSNRSYLLFCNMKFYFATKSHIG